MSRHYWQPWEEELMRQHYATSLTADLARVLGLPARRVFAKANAMGLHKTSELIAETARERTNRPDHGSTKTRFKPGMTPANKGMKHAPGWAPGNMASTQFKAGNRPCTWQPVGTQVVNSDGVLDEKVTDGPGPRNLRWKPVHRLVWERANGQPVPEGYVVVFRPGRKTVDPELITPDAVELITRQELLQRNSVHRHGPEIASIHQLRGQIRRQINKLNKDTP